MMFSRLLEANGGIPDNAEAVFCNTGKEREETLDFLQEMSERWNARITWLEYAVDKSAGGTQPRTGRNTFRVVDYSSASRNGEPFEALIQREGRVPSRTARFCTRELKTRTTNRYFSAKGLPARKRTEIIGIRADESRRVHHALMSECRTDYPLVHARITLPHVIRFWSQQPFDLAIDSVFGNCDLCFLKGYHKRLRILRADPKIADWWIRMEEMDGHFKAKRADRLPFRDDRTVRQVRDESLSPMPSLFEHQDDDDVSCFCGD